MDRSGLRERPQKQRGRAVHQEKKGAESRCTTKARANLPPGEVALVLRRKIAKGRAKDRRLKKGRGQNRGEVTSEHALSIEKTADI